MSTLTTAGPLSVLRSAPPSYRQRQRRTRVHPATKLVNCILVAVYLALLVKCYVDIVSPVYAYAGLVNRSPDAWPCVLGALSCIVCSLALPAGCKRPSDYASLLLFLGVIAPCSVIPFFLKKVPDQEIFKMLGILIGGFLCFEVSRRRPPLRLPVLPEFGYLHRVVVPTMVAVTALAVFGLVGYRVDMSMGGGMYARRIAARSLLQAGSVLSYARGIMAKAGLTMVSSFIVAHKRLIYLPILVFGVVSFISFDGQKAFFYGPIMCLVLGLTVRRYASRPMSSALAVFASVLVVLFAMAEVKLIGSNYIAVEFVRRLLYIPAQLTTYYFEFFADNPHVWMTDGLVSALHLASPVYALPLGQVIGLSYFGRVNTNANVNLWASAYAHFNVLGVFVTSLAAGVVLRVIDSLTKQREAPAKYMAGVITAAMTAVIWSQGAFHTSLVSDGVGISILLLACFPSTDEKRPLAHQRKAGGRVGA